MYSTVPTAIPAPVRLSSGVSVLWCERPDAHRKTRWNHRGGSGSPLIYLLFLLAHAAERLSRELPRPFEASTAWCRSRSARRPCVHLWQIQSPGHMLTATIFPHGGCMANLKGLESIVSQLRQQRADLVNQLRHVDAALSVLGKLNGGRFYTKPRRRLSASARRKIAAAQRARWAKQKVSAKRSSTTAAPKRHISAAGRARIRAAARARWAKVKQRKKAA